MTLFFTLFVAGLLTILLPCILPLIPIVLGVSIAGRSKWRPLLTIAGMLVSFIGFTFLLLVVLEQFVELADYIRIATYYVLLLFGLGFLTHNRTIHIVGSIIGGFFFLEKGILSVAGAIILGIIAMEIGGRVASKLQQLGTDLQLKARDEFGNDAPITAFLIGLTLGLVWVPCAGPALGFALALVREQPGFLAAAYLGAYGLGTAVPLLAIGYGGQAAVHSVRAISQYTGIIKQTAGVLLILSAIGLQFRLFEKLQIFILDNTSFGELGISIEERIFGDELPESMLDPPLSIDSMGLPKLPKITRAPEFTGLGKWFNSEPLTMQGLRGKVVLIDFWTYSCINCIRTLPYMRGYWDKFQDQPFVLIGVHTPEFVFEKSEENVADAIARHELTYPIVQDNDFGTWRAFANRYWPAKYLIDADGYIRYTHFGEGAYDETDLAIQSLLAEMGHTVDAPLIKEEEAKARGGGQSPETYLGTRSWPSLGNGPTLPTDEVHSYEAPESMTLHKYYLVGEWQLDGDERQILRSDSGEIRMKFLGGEANIVLGPIDPEGVIEGEIEIDGKVTKTITIDHHDLYNLFEGESGEHEVILRLKSPGVAGYAFTFGS